MASDDPEGWDFFNATIAHADGDAGHPHPQQLQQRRRDRGERLPVALRRADPEVHARGLRADGRRRRSGRRGRSSAATSAASRCRSRTGSRAFWCRASSSARSARCEILRDPALGSSLGRRGKEHVRTHFLMPRYLRDYLRIFNELAGVMTRREPAQRTPLRAGEQPRAGHLPGGRRGAARLGRPGDGAHRAGVAPRSDLDRLGDERARRARSRSRTANGRSRCARPTAASTRCGWSSATPRPTTASTTCSPTRCCGSSSTTCGTSRTRPDIRREEIEAFEFGYNVVNEDLARAVVEELEGDARAGGDGPRLPPLHAAGPRAQGAPGRVPAPLRPHPLDPVGRLARAAHAHPRGDLRGAARERHHRLPHALLPAQLPAVLPRPDGPRGRLRARRRALRRARGVGARLPAADRPPRDAPDRPGARGWREFERGAAATAGATS